MDQAAHDRLRSCWQKEGQVTEGEAGRGTCEQKYHISSEGERRDGGPAGADWSWPSFAPWQYAGDVKWSVMGRILGELCVTWALGAET